MTFDEIMIAISVIIFLLLFISFPFMPLLMWYLADKFGSLDIDENN